VPRVDNVEEIDLGDDFLLPGLIDSHLHLALGRGGTYEDMMKDSDGVHLMTGIKNSYESLKTGVRTVKEAGARNKVASTYEKVGRLDYSRDLDRLFQVV
jgi:imidazolonepropionase-like amidohydrolase